MASFGPVIARYREPSWRGFALAVVVAAIGTLFIIDPIFRPEDGGTRTMLFPVGFVLFVAGLVTAIATRKFPAFQETEGTIEVKDGTVFIDGKTRLAGVERTTLDQDADACVVSFFDGGRFPKLEMRFGSFDEAQRIRRAAEATEPTLSSYRVAGLSTRAGRYAFVAGVVTIAAGGVFGVMLGKPMLYVIAALGLLLLRVEGRARIGADGIVVSCLGVAAFIPFSDVVRVEWDYGVVLHRKDGSSLRLREPSDTNEAGAAMMAKIEKARAAALDTTSTERLLTRGERDEAAWRAELLRLGAPTYRNQALERERLWEVFENPGADESARRGAAFLLRHGATSDERVRIAQVRARVASPELREQLEADEEAPEKLSRAR